MINPPKQPTYKKKVPAITAISPKYQQEHENTNIQTSIFSRLLYLDNNCNNNLANEIHKLPKSFSSNQHSPSNNNITILLSSESRTSNQPYKIKTHNTLIYIYI